MLRDLRAQILLRLRLLGYSKILVVLMTILYGFTLIAELALGSNLAYALLGAEIVSLVVEGQLWRLLTYTFLHGNIIHLLFNMYALWILGQFVERYFGRQTFFSVFIIGSILAGVTSFFSSALVILGGMNQYSDVATVGASGAIFAFLGLIFGNIVRTRRYGFQLPIDQGGLLTIIIANLLLGFMIPGIDNAAHIGGLVTGFLMAFIFEQQLSFDTSSWKKTTSRLLFYLSWLLLFAAVAAHLVWLMLVGVSLT